MTDGADPLPPEVDDLFLGPPGDFIKARDRLAKELKADKRTDLSKAVKALRRPTLAAWGVNQLAHRDRAELDALFAITAELSDEQDRAVRGRGEADRMRSLSQQHRAAITKLADLAAAHLDELSGSGASQRDEIVAAIERATTDTTVHHQVLAGRLSVIPDADPMSAFGGLLSSDVLASVPDRVAGETSSTSTTSKKAKKARRPAADPSKADGAEAGGDGSEDADAEQAPARAAIERAREELDERQAQVDATSRAVIEAEERDAEAERRVDDAKAALETRREERAAAAEVLRERRRAERDARADLGKAERRLRALEPD